MNEQQLFIRMSGEAIFSTSSYKGMGNVYMIYLLRDNCFNLRGTLSPYEFACYEGCEKLGPRVSSGGWVVEEMCKLEQAIEVFRRRRAFFWCSGRVARKRRLDSLHALTSFVVRGKQICLLRNCRRSSKKSNAKDVKYGHMVFLGEKIMGRA